MLNAENIVIIECLGHPDASLRTAAQLQALQRQAQNSPKPAPPLSHPESSKKKLTELYPKTPATHDGRVAALVNCGWRLCDAVAALEATRDEFGTEDMRLVRSAAVARANLFTACFHQHTGCRTPQQSQSLWIRLPSSSGARMLQLHLLVSSSNHPRALRVSADTARSRTALSTALRRELPARLAR